MAPASRPPAPAVRPFGPCGNRAVIAVRVWRLPAGRLPHRRTQCVDAEPEPTSPPRPRRRSPLPRPRPVVGPIAGVTRGVVLGLERVVEGLEARCWWPMRGWTTAVRRRAGWTHPRHPRWTAAGSPSGHHRADQRRGERGLLGLASNELWFVAISVSSSTTRTATATRSSLVPRVGAVRRSSRSGQEEVLLRIEQPSPTQRRGACLRDDGKLYIATGDGGRGAIRSIRVSGLTRSGQDPEDRRGPRRRRAAVCDPPDNPFVAPRRRPRSGRTACATPGG